MAIAADSVGQASGLNPTTPLTFSYTNTAGVYLVIAVQTFTDDRCTGVTYGGVSLTQLVKRRTTIGNQSCVYLYGLDSPPTGSNTVSIAFTGSPLVVVAVCSSYTGAQLDTSTAVSKEANALNITDSITTVGNNSWAIMGLMVDLAGNPTAGTGAFLRKADTTYGSLTIFDSNSAITPASSYSMTVNANNGLSNDILTDVIISLAPRVAGGSLIKTINGLAIASVKTVNGLSISSIKTVNGLTNV